MEERNVARSRSRGAESGQQLVEFAVIYSAVVLPVTFALIFTAQLLWIWHSVADFTRDGARYAATHCWQNGAGNVLEYMRSRVPLMFDREQFVSGPAEIQVQYFSRDPDTGALAEFSCDGECSAQCVPDTVSVQVANYEFRTFLNYLGLAPVQIPSFVTSVPIESAGCDPEQATCVP